VAHDIWRGFQFYDDRLLQAKRQLVDWYNDGLDRGEALVLAGPPGTGKTHLAYVVLAAYGAPHQSFMIGEPDLVANVRASYDGEGSERMIMAQYRRAPLLILDDLGTAYVKQPEWIQDIYWRILDRRAELKLATLITTNLDMPALSDRLGGRAYSRLMGMLGNEANYVNLFGLDDYRLRWDVAGGPGREA